MCDENADPFTKTVQVTITGLCRRLHDPDVIETIPGIGHPDRWPHHPHSS